MSAPRSLGGTPGARMVIPTRMAAAPMASLPKPGATNAGQAAIVAQAKAKGIVLPKAAPQAPPKKPAFVTSYNPTGPGAAIAQTANFKAAVAAGLVAPPTPPAIPVYPMATPTDAGAYSGSGGGSGSGDSGDAAPAPQDTTPVMSAVDDTPDPSADRGAQLAALYGATPDDEPSPQEQMGAASDDDIGPTGYYTSDDEDADDAAFDRAVDAGAGSVEQSANYPGRTDDTEFVPPQSFDNDSPVHGDAISGLHCYVSRGKLTCMGLVKTRYGNLPIVTHIRVPVNTPEGPVSISGDGDEIDATIFGEMASAADYETMKRDAESQVVRAREGDENAMAMIRAVTESAKAGSQRARVAHGIISAYIKAHPVKDGEDPIGFEPLPPFVAQNVRAAVRLANGPRITEERLASMAATFAGESNRGARIMQFGADNFQDDKALADAKRSLVSHTEAALLELGKIVGHAIALQRVREPGAPISAFSADVAWELGD